MPNPLFIAVARLITKFSPAQEGILRLYVHYKRSQRNPDAAPQTQALARVIQNELQLVVKDEKILKTLAVNMQLQLQTQRYSEDYFGELALWIVAIRNTQAAPAVALPVPNS